LLLLARMLLACFVAAAFGIALVVACLFSPERINPVFFGLLAITTPAISYFSTVFSNYPFLVAGFLVQGAAMVALWQSAKHPSHNRSALASGVLAGAGTAIALCASVNGVVSLVLWAALVPAFVFLTTRAKSPPRFSLQFVGIFAVSLLVVCSLVWAFGGGAAFLPAHLSDALGKLAPEVIPSMVIPWLLPMAFVFLVGALALAAGFLGRQANVSGKASGLWRMVGIVLLAVCVISLLVQPPAKLSDVMVHASAPEQSLAAYTSSVSFNFLDGFLPGETDWYVVDSFWGVLGWLDTPLPEPLIIILRVFLGVGLLVFLLTSLLNSPSNSSLPLFSCLCFAGVVAAAAAVGVLYYAAAYNVHGRYLLGPYTFAVALAACGYGCLLQRLSKEVMFTVVSGCVLLASLIQLTVWSSLLDRYF
jgi:hypothetical protein